MNITKAVVFTMLALCLSFPACGYGNAHNHKKALHASAIRNVRAAVPANPNFFLFKEFPDLRAIKNFSLKVQNEVADRYSLARAVSRNDYDRLVADGYLVPVPKTMACAAVDPHLDRWLAALNPWALDYLRNELVPAYCASAAAGLKKLHPLIISSLTRTSDYQRLLARYNGNAKAALGDGNPYRRSSHNTGFSFDISARDLGPGEMRWLGAYLLREKQAGRLVEAIFEVQQNHFHIMVYPPSQMLFPCLVVP